MKLSEYLDEDIINEIKYRNLKVELRDVKLHTKNWFCRFVADECKIVIGGIEFDIS